MAKELIKIEHVESKTDGKITDDYYRISKYTESGSFITSITLTLTQMKELKELTGKIMI